MLTRIAPKVFLFGITIWTICWLFGTVSYLLLDLTEGNISSNSEGTNSSKTELFAFPNEALIQLLGGYGVEIEPSADVPGLLSSMEHRGLADRFTLDEFQL